jgi:predicted deacetylase
MRRIEPAEPPGGGTGAHPATRALCVSIHDVAPATWPLCLKLIEALREVDQFPVTWLVVPCFHGDTRRSLGVEAQLDYFQSEGHELALHGYTHADRRPPATSLGERFRRHIYTESEGEFSALDADEARRLLARGTEWFIRRGWPSNGFVAPAWLLSKPAWQVLRASRFSYTTTFTRFYNLPTGESLFSPSLVYTARNRAGRLFSPPAASTLAGLLSGAPLVRLSLHPRDALHPQLVLHAQRLVEKLLATRRPMTKLAFRRAYFHSQAEHLTARAGAY